MKHQPNKQNLLIIAAGVVLFIALPALVYYNAHQKNLNTNAAGAASIEPETGTRAGSTTIVNDANASGGQYLKIGSASAVAVTSLSAQGTSTAAPTVVNYTLQTTGAVTVDDLVVAVRDQAGTGYDFPAKTNVSLSGTQSFSSQATLPAGTYTYWIAYYHNGFWSGLAPTNSLTISASAPTVTPTPTPAGWVSGAATSDTAAFGTWRSRSVEAFRYGSCIGNWSQISSPDCGQIAENPTIPLLLIGIGMLPSDNSGNFATCATGAYNSYFTSVGTQLISKNRAASVIALGWEANGNWMPWSIGVQSGNTSATTIANYKACFRQEAQALKAADPQARISWNMNSDSYMGTTSVADAYPGDDVVDDIAVDYYDIDYQTSTQSVWNTTCNATQNGGPKGLCTWLQFAQSHGKKLGVPEWGLWTGDDPSYIQMMYNFFLTNSSSISYESYFNAPSETTYSHLVYPSTNNPNGSTKYQQLWAASPR